MHNDKWAFFVMQNPKHGSRWAVFNGYGKLSGWLRKKQLQRWIEELGTHTVADFI